MKLICYLYWSEAFKPSVQWSDGQVGFREGRSQRRTITSCDREAAASNWPREGTPRTHPVNFPASFCFLFSAIRSFKVFVQCRRSRARRTRNSLRHCLTSRRHCRASSRCSLSTASISWRRRARGSLVFHDRPSTHSSMTKANALRKREEKA
jgi:hypothetical protein